MIHALFRVAQSNSAKRRGRESDTQSGL
jgi:hypothetical protein